MVGRVRDGHGDPRMRTTRWAPWEHNKLIRLVAEGKSNREIAGMIGRTQCAVGARAQEYRLRTNPVEPPKITIAKTELIGEVDVPAWYALGWRFVGFYGSRCKMEWTSSRPERRPGYKSRHIVMPIIPQHTLSEMV